MYICVIIFTFSHVFTIFSDLAAMPVRSVPGWLQIILGAFLAPFSTYEIYQKQEVIPGVDVTAGPLARQSESKPMIWPLQLVILKPRS